MELELDRAQLSGYETVLDTTVCHEETLEMIVPDACPDILRICDTEGLVYLKSKEALEGRIEVSGTVRAAILYLPDGAEGMRCIEAALPFTCAVDSGAVGPHCTVAAVPRVTSAETRSLNPRKVLVRVNLAVAIQVYAPVSGDLCAGVAAPEEHHVEQLVERCDTLSVSCVQEKQFTFSDDVALPGSRPEAEELLRARTALHCAEAKVIGSKLILKGEAQLQVLYRAEGGALCTAEFELPFSQIMEVGGIGEEAACQVQILLTNGDFRMDAGDGRTISVALDLLAQAVVWEERTLEVLSDAYSTACPVTVETQEYTVSRLLDRGTKEQTVREILETGVPAREVSDAYVTIGSERQRREGSRLMLEAEARVTVLYTAEDGNTASVTSPIQVSCPLELPEEAVCSSRCLCPAPVFATATTGGIEVRFPVHISYLALERRRMVAIAALRTEEAAEQKDASQPSVVLRMVGREERLWDIAKAYGTTARDIMRANGMEEDAVPGGQLLLIPRSR